MKITEAEKEVRDQLEEAGIDEPHGVVKLGGYWLIWKQVPGGTYTEQAPGSLVQSKSLDKAIRMAREGSTR